MGRKLMQVLAGFIPAIVALAFYVKYEVVMGAKAGSGLQRGPGAPGYLRHVRRAGGQDQGGERLAAERNENTIALFAATIERLQAQTDEARALAAVAHGGSRGAPG